jgi:small subunit ribosomal protein S7
MPRRGNIPKRKALPDPVFQSPLVTKFINCMMIEGKKSVSESTFYGAMETIRERTNEDPLKVFRGAVDAVEVRPQRRQALALRWLISYARQRPEKSMRDKLANEIMDAASGRGATFKKKEDTHRMAEANKAFAHYRW